jgi:glycosyltransferase involved in cell wall biosynthesis
MSYKNSNITVGVVIPNLNQTKFIRTALESIKHQNVNIQLALMDGGSTDKIGEVYEQYKDLITFYRSQKDKGQSAAIAEGWRKINCDIIGWLNADDYLFPYALDEIVQCFEDNPTIDVIYGDAVHVSENGSFIGYFPSIQPYEKSRLGNDNFICQPTCFVRRKTYKKISGLDKHLYFTMDWDLWCQLSKIDAHFKYLKSPIAAVRYYKGTKTSTQSRRRYREIINIQKKYGNRTLPTSFLGADFYGLSLSKRPNFSQKSYLMIFGMLRTILYCIKKRKHKARKLYGISILNGTVNKRCTIHLPWYRKSHQWNNIRLKLEPYHGNYLISINNNKISYKASTNGRIHIPLRKDYAPILTMVISATEKTKWKIIEFECF